jgi:hypothetical protein
MNADVRLVDLVGMLTRPGQPGAQAVRARAVGRFPGPPGSASTLAELGAGGRPA